MMAKKAQMSMFIIVGVLILVLVGILAYSGMKKEEGQREVAIKESIEMPAELKPVGAFVQSCLEQEAEKTINITALQGGRPLAPRHPYKWDNMTLSHGYYYGLNELPTLEEMQSEMAGYLKLGLGKCLNNLNDFRAKGMDLSIGEMDPEFIVGSDAVVVDLDYPVTLTSEGKEITAEKFSVTVPSRLGYMHDAARKIVDEDVKTKGGATFNYAWQLKVGMEIRPIEEFIVIVNLFDEKSLGDKQAMSFDMVNNYMENNKPVMDYISNVIAHPGEEVSFQVTAEDEDGDDLVFSDESGLFDIDPQTGEVQFTAPEIGSEIAHVMVSDQKGGTDEKVFKINIIGGPEEAAEEGA